MDLYELNNFATMGLLLQPVPPLRDRTLQRLFHCSVIIAIVHYFISCCI